MLKMTPEELILLRQLAEKEQIISDNKNAAGLKRLIEAGYVTETALNMSSTAYKSTNKGRDALAACGEADDDPAAMFFDGH